MKVDDESYFKDHIASRPVRPGALTRGSASAYPATDARPIYAKPIPARRLVRSPPSRTTPASAPHHTDQLFDQAIGGAFSTPDERSGLVKHADARICGRGRLHPALPAAELVAARPDLANAGAFGFQEPEAEDIGYLKPRSRPPSGSPSTGS
ncbi:hypothetical protein [Streptomyces sp. KL116D]|uniref:hypothetical protein n=1 Tax=Streptomyces sp. KL116D TaxID=3045152 RepID=UPI003556A130